MRRPGPGATLAGLVLAGLAVAQPPLQDAAPAPAAPLAPPRQVQRAPGVPRAPFRVQRANAKGNDALLAGEATRAKAAYESAQVLAPEIPQLGYNVGVAALLAGELDAAQAALAMPIGVSSASSAEGEPAERAAAVRLEQDSRFNLAHVALRRQEIEAAVGHLAHVVAGDSGADDARRNLELALRLLEKKEEEQQEENQEQKKEDQEKENQENPDQNDQQQDQQPQDQQDSGQQGEDQQDEGGSGEDQPQPSRPDEPPGQQAPGEPEPSPQPPERAGQMTRDKALELLDSLAADEKRALKAMQEGRARRLPPPKGKGW